MANFVGDIYQVTLESDYLGVLCSNVFHYRLMAVGGAEFGAETLADAFADVIIPPLRNLANFGVLYTTIKAFSLLNLEDFHIKAINIRGDTTTEVSSYLPSFLAVSFRYVRSSMAYRDGGKRFAGLDDTQVTGNLWVGPSGNLDAMKAALISDLAGVGVGAYTWSPYVASRPIVYGANPAGYIPSSVEFNGVSTQNTRKS